MSEDPLGSGPGYIPPASEHLAVTVDVVIFNLAGNDLKVLLVSRAYPPFKNKWAIPGGFVKPAEALDEAARRELAEETAVREVYLEQLYTFGDPQRDPRGRVITVAYFAVMAGEVPTRAGDDASAAAWHSVYALPELAFDHAVILKYALQRLRYKLEYTSVGFELLPNEFTLTDLQTAYEIVLGETIDKRNFRRRILEADILTSTGKYRAEGQGRPAQLYRYRKNAVKKKAKARRLYP
jgi:8-oxo-dGTP diphosphatase